MALEFCDKCQGKIENGKCPCGTWFETYDDILEFSKLMKKCLDAYGFLHDQDKSLDFISGDDCGKTAIMLFKGNYEDCENLKKEYYRMKGLK